MHTLLTCGMINVSGDHYSPIPWHKVAANLAVINLVIATMGHPSNAVTTG